MHNTRQGIVAESFQKGSIHCLLLCTPMWCDAARDLGALQTENVRAMVIDEADAMPQP